VKDGASLFGEEFWVSEEHQKWLPETYFPLVMKVNRFPRYKNKRSADIYVKSFMDENHIEQAPEWGLPVPNQEAAYKSMSKYAKDIPNLEIKQVEGMNEAWEWTERHFSPYMSGARIRTTEEVVAKLDKTTSTGFPFNSEFAKKKELFENDPDIIPWLIVDWDNLLDPNYTFCNTNSLKEEVRPTAKTLENKIRTFTAGATDGTVQGNRLFEDMNEKMNSSYLRSSSGVGMSPFKGNWDILYRKLNIFRQGYALDESEYDSSLRANMMWGCAKLRWNMYHDEDRTPENLQRLKVYYRNLVNSLVITPEGVLVMKLGGNPSGSVNTINDNTLILYTLLAYAWIMLSEKPNYTEFEMNTSKILVGDDNTWTVSDWAHKFYNARTVISEWNTIGVKTTTDSMEPRSAQDLDFLSARTIFYCGKAIPIYDRNKLMTSLLYANTEKQSPAFTLLRVAALLQIGWSDTQFRRFSREFIAWLLEKFDAVCSDDLDWIEAKCSILNDARLADLFLGENVAIEQQGLSGEQERLEMPDKRMSQPTRSKKSRSRRGKGEKATRKMRTIMVQPGDVRYKGPGTSFQLPVQKQPRRGPRRRGGGRGQNSSTGQGRARTRNVNRKNMVIEEDEYIGEVIGNATGANFKATSYSVNIGQAGTFPWGAGVAKNNFEKYEFEYLEFYYKPEGGEYATNTQTGKVMLAFDSDAADATPTSKQQMEAMDPHADDMPSKRIKLVIPPRMFKKFVDGYFIRPAGLPGATDIKTYDVGNLIVATQGLNANTATVGELRVRYKCRVMIPVLEAIAAAPINNSASFFITAAGEVAIATTVNFQLVFSTAVTNGLAIVNTLGSFVPPAGNYLLDVTYVGVSSTSIALIYSVSPYKNAVQFVQTPQYQSSAFTSQTICASYYVSSNGTDAFTFVANATFATGTFTVYPSIRWVAI